MTVTLTYDPTLSRVRLSADGLGAADYATVERSTDQLVWSIVRGGVRAPIVQRMDFRHTFSAVAANGWGPADTGQATTTDGGAAANYSATGSVGLISVASLNVDRFVDFGLSLADVDLVDEVQSPVTPTGGNFEIKIRARYVDTANFVGARIFLAPGGGVSCSVQQVVGGVETNAGFPAVPGVIATSLIAYRFQASGNLIRFRAWLSGTAEPATWITAMTTTHTTAGSVRVGNLFTASVSNALPVAIAHDNTVVGPRIVAVDDYEFVAGVANHYRIRGIEAGPIEFVGAGAAVAGDNTSLTPAQPTGLLPGDAKVTFAAIRNNGTGTVNTPAGWQVLRHFGASGGVQRNGTLLSRPHAAGDSSPLVTFAGGVVGVTTSAQMAAWRRAEVVFATGIDQLNGAPAQNIAYPGVTLPEDGMLVILALWKQDDWTPAGASTPSGFVEVGDAPSTLGDDQGIAWNYQIQTDKADVPGGTITITGGGVAISRAMLVVLRHAPYLNEQTGSLTPQLDRIWVKSVMRPFLNRPFTVVGRPEPERPGRGNDFDAVGRTFAIAVTDVGSGKRFSVDIHCATAEEAQTLDYIVASGDVLFVHTPPGCPIPGGHVLVDASRERSPHQRSVSRVVTLPLRQVAAPGPDVVGATSTWQTVLSGYASWPAVLAANPTWPDLLARIAPPSEVIVP